jgi:tRNA (adenine57-N1/adenine58-N1)-methyltransferase
VIGFVAAAGDLAMVVGEDRKQFLFSLRAGAQFQSHHGILAHDDLIGRPWGSRVETHLEHTFVLLEPSLRDLLLLIKRRSQIIFPKDLGYILLRLSVGPGRRVLEAGTGSGALTMALAWMVGDHGRVISVDRRPDMQRLARENLEQAGLAQRVDMVEADLADVPPVSPPVDALFLDVPNTEMLLAAALRHLRPGGSFGAILPTANQVQDLLRELETHRMTDVDACEILLRFYKTVPARLRPADRMVAHTGYLVFGRATEPRLMDDPDGRARSGEPDPEEIGE